MDINVMYMDKNGRILHNLDESIEVSSDKDLEKAAKEWELPSVASFVGFYKPNEDEPAYVMYTNGMVWDHLNQEWIIPAKYDYVEDAFDDGVEFDDYDNENYTVKEFNGEKYILLDKVNEDGLVVAVKVSDEVDYETGHYTCPLYSLEFDSEDDDDPLIRHTDGDIVYIE